MRRKVRFHFTPLAQRTVGDLVLILTLAGSLAGPYWQITGYVLVYTVLTYLKYREEAAHALP